jgi:hypothetical protein
MIRSFKEKSKIVKIKTQNNLNDLNLKEKNIFFSQNVLFIIHLFFILIKKYFFNKKTKFFFI